MRDPRERCRPRPEVEFVLQCARTRVEAERMTTIRRLAGESLDWNVLLRFAFATI